MMPAFETGVPVMMRLEFVLTVVPLGIESRPLVLIVPLFQLIDVFVTLIGAVPVSVQPDIVSVGTVSAEALFKVSVPPLQVRLPVPPMLVSVFVPPELIVAPLVRL